MLGFLKKSTPSTFRELKQIMCWLFSWINNFFICITLNDFSVVKLHLLPSLLFTPHTVHPHELTFTHKNSKLFLCSVLDCTKIIFLLLWETGIHFDLSILLPLWPNHQISYHFLTLLKLSFAIFFLVLFCFFLRNVILCWLDKNIFFYSVL